MRSMHLDFAPLQSLKSRPCRVLPLARKRRSPSNGDRLGATREMRGNVFFFFAWSVGLEFAKARPVHVRTFGFSSPSLGMPSLHGNAGPVHVSNSSIRLISRAFPSHGARAAFLLRAVPIFPHTPRLYRASHGSAAVHRPRVTVGTVGRVRRLLLSWDVWLRRLRAHSSTLRHVVHVDGSDETCGDE